MKKLFPLLLLIVAGCAADTIPALNEKNDGECVALRKNGCFQVSLESNPSTGYRWEVSPSKCVLLERSFSLPEEKTGLCGAPGTERFLFRADFSGEENLQFSYRRAWEKTPPVKTFSVKVKTAK